MLTCFNLKPGITIDELRWSLADLTAHLRDVDLVQSTGPIGRLQRHPIMDTDTERHHEYYFIVSFRDRAQMRAGRGVSSSHEGPAESLHKAVYSIVKDEIFICWEDL